MISEQPSHLIVIPRYMNNLAHRGRIAADPMPSGLHWEPWTKTNSVKLGVQREEMGARCRGICEQGGEAGAGRREGEATGVPQEPSYSGGILL